MPAAAADADEPAILAGAAPVELNTESYPNSFNSWDSYAESFMKAGDNPQALRYYRKSLQINPANTNATTQLASLGAN